MLAKFKAGIVFTAGSALCVAARSEYLAIALISATVSWWLLRRGGRFEVLAVTASIGLFVSAALVLATNPGTTGVANDLVGAAMLTAVLLPVLGLSQALNHIGRSEPLHLRVAATYLKYAAMAERCVQRRYVVLISLSIVCLCIALGTISALSETRVYLGFSHLVLASGTYLYCWQQLKCMLALDALLGACATFGLARLLGVSRLGAAVAACLWTVAASRIGAVTSGGVVSFLLPLFAYCARRNMESRGFPWLLAAMLAVLATAFLSPLLLVSEAVLLISGIATGRRSVLSWGQCLSIAGCVLIATVLWNFAPIRLPSVLVGPLVAERLRDIGADGAYPWEILYPSVTSGAFHPLLMSVLNVFGRWGDAVAMTSAPGWATSFLALFALSLRATRARTFVVFARIAIVTSLFVALPSHIFGIPFPDVALFFSLIQTNVANFSSAALAATLCMVVLAGFSIDALIALRTRTSYLLLVIASTFLVLDAVPNRAALVEIGSSNLIGAIEEALIGKPTERVLMLPQVDAGGPRDRRLRETLAFMRLNPNRADDTSRFPHQSLDGQSLKNYGFVLLDRSAYDSYVPDAQRAFVLLPPDLMRPAWNPHIPPDIFIDGLTIKAMHGSFVLYRRALGK